MPTPKNNSVLKAFDILRLLAGEPRGLSPQQIAAETGATLSTTHRFLLTLEDIGAVSRRQGNLYTLGMLIFELGQSTRRDQILTERAKILIEALAEEIGETVSLTLFTDTGVQKVAWHEPRRALVVRERTDFGPAFHLTSVGKLYLAGLPAMVCEESLSLLRFDRLTPQSVTSVEALRAQIHDIRATGIAIGREETEIGLVELSVPITASSGDERLGALTLSGPASRLDDDRIRHCVAAMTRTIETLTSHVFARAYTIPGKARPRGSFPHVKRVGNLVFLSGTSSRRPDETFAGVQVADGGAVQHDTYEQTRETMLNVADILDSLALKTSDIVSLEAFLTCIDDAAAFHAALNSTFRGNLPAVTVTSATALPHPHQAVMVKAVACADGR